MRAISDTALATLSNAQGIEPVNLVRVFWTDTTDILYGDRAFIEGEIVGGLLELSNVESVVNVSKASNTSSITVKLNDTDGVIHRIFCNNDIVKRTVYVYQWFASLTLTDAFVIFEGEISTPITWKEGERTITFDVLSKIEDLQYGFSADEGNFEYIPEGIVGKAWPLPFGTVDLVPSLQLFDLPAGILQNSTAQSRSNSGRNASQAAAYAKAINGYNDCTTKANHCFDQARTVQFDGGPAPSQVFVLPSQSLHKQVAVNITDQWNLKAHEYQDQAEQFREQAVKILAEMNQPQTQDNTLVVQGNFPQGVPTTLQVGPVTYTGEFSGNVFTVLSSSDPFATDGSLLSGPLTINDSQAATQYSAQLNEQNFFYAVAGSAVIASGGLNYIVSLLEVNVLGVYSNYNGLTTAVPANLYTLSYVDFGPIQATYIEFPKALSLIDSKWSDSIFCSVTSPIGPNIVDTLIWLIQNYTYHGYDGVSFGIVRGQIDSYPANFVLTDQGNIVKLLQDIAFQARCALWYKEGYFYIKLLAEMGSYVDSITESDVEYATMEISCTPTEELVTKYTATYKIAANQPSDDLVIWYYNLLKYGLIEKTDAYYIYNIPDLVTRCSMFWLVRYTNSWKRLKVSTFLTKLKLETFDYVLVNFTRTWVSNTPVIGMVESCLYDSANNRVELTIWLPIRFGEMTVYPFATPYAIDPTLVFPEVYEQANAGTPNQTATGSLIPQGAVTNPQTGSHNPTQNGVAPSDSGFTAPTFTTQLDPTAFSNTAPPSGSTVSNQYAVKDVVDSDVSFDISGVYPGIVQTQQNGNFYNVNIWFKGLNNPPTSTLVKQLGINPNDIIPQGTPTLVSRNRIVVSTDTVTGLITYKPEYTMQVPVWLKSKSAAGGSSASNPPPVPVPDPGTPPSPAPTPAPEADSGDE